jgi:hypothetical protein
VVVYSIGPLATVSSHHPGGPVVKLQLTDCEADYECYSASGQELQRSLSRMDTLPKGGARVMVAKVWPPSPATIDPLKLHKESVVLPLYPTILVEQVDPMKLEQLRQTFPGESDVRSLHPSLPSCLPLLVKATYKT